jgi:hypothetical protein
MKETPRALLILLVAKTMQGAGNMRHAAGDRAG